MMLSMLLHVLPYSRVAYWVLTMSLLWVLGITSSQKTHQMWGQKLLQRLCDKGCCNMQSGVSEWVQMEGEPISFPAGESWQHMKIYLSNEQKQRMSGSHILVRLCKMPIVSKSIRRPLSLFHVETRVSQWNSGHDQLDLWARYALC